MRKTLWIILILVLGSCAGIARADVTFDVSASLSAKPIAGEPVGYTPSCGGSGCTLSGTIVINTTSGTVDSVDLTMNGELPSFGPFVTLPEHIFTDPYSAYSNIVLEEMNTPDPAGTTGYYALGLELATPLPGSLVGYIGGNIIGGSVGVNSSPYAYESDMWSVTSGSVWASVTPPVTYPTVPEPCSFSLLLLGVGMALGLRKLIA
jgi:hypothetical protein